LNAAGRGDNERYLCVWRTIDVQTISDVYTLVSVSCCR